MSECQPSATLADVQFSSKQLERDPSETAAELLVVLVSHFNGSGIPSRSELSLDHFATRASARVTNAFWFLSLSLALVVSMLAILAKQWITMFSSRMRAPVANFRRWAHRHRVFRDGIDRWHINAFVSSLSVALHGAVLMFLVGLNVHLFTRDLIIFGLVFGVTVLAIAFYVAAAVAPLFDGTCPTATPLLVHSRVAFLVILRMARRLCRIQTPYPVLGYHPPHGDKPPFDPDVVLAGGGDSRRDVRILILMLTTLPSGHDVDTVLDAVGALKSGMHDLGDDDLARLRHHARRRLEHLGSAVETAATDAAAVARALRSSIFVESCCGHMYWENIGMLLTNLGSIRTHDIFALSTALRLQLQRHELYPEHAMEQQPPSSADREQYRDQPAVPQSLTLVLPRHLSRGHALLQQRLQSGRLDQRLEPGRLYQRLQRRWLEQLQHSFIITEAIAKWNIRVPRVSHHSISSQTRAYLFDGISQIMSSFSANQPVNLSVCAALVIGFGGEINLRRQCHDLVTPLAIAALGRERERRSGKPRWPAWQPLPDSADWRLRAIDLWAYVTANLYYLEPSNSLVGEVYGYILTQWLGEEWWPRFPTVARLRSIIISPDQLKLPATARATLWNISRLTLARAEPSLLQPGIIRNILCGISSDEMVAARSAIVIWIFDFVCRPHSERLKHLQISYEYFSSAHRHLLALMEPSLSITSPELETTWQILHPYLVASPDDESLADLAADASVVLSIHAGMSGDASALFEQLLGAGIGRRVVLSHKTRNKALLVATHARLFAATWWEEMRSELLQIDLVQGTWKATEDFEDAAAFVRKVEEGEVCFDCIQKGCAWLPQLEEERYYDAWIHHAENIRSIQSLQVTARSADESVLKVSVCLCCSAGRRG